jgi:hypothetical protein
MSDSETSWTSERSLVRRVDGNADGFEVVTTTFDEVSLYGRLGKIFMCIHSFILHTIILRTAQIALDMSLPSSIWLKQIAAIGAEDK